MQLVEEVSADIQNRAAQSQDNLPSVTDLMNLTGVEMIKGMMSSKTKSMTAIKADKMLRVK